MAPWDTVDMDEASMSLTVDGHRMYFAVDAGTPLSVESDVLQRNTAVAVAVATESTLAATSEGMHQFTQGVVDFGTPSQSAVLQLNGSTFALLLRENVPLPADLSIATSGGPAAPADLSLLLTFNDALYSNCE